MGEWFASKPHLLEVCKRVCTLMHKPHLRIQFQWVPCEEKKEADGAYSAACTAGGAVIALDNTGSLSEGAANVVACPTARANIHAHNNSVATQFF